MNPSELARLFSILELLRSRHNWLEFSFCKIKTNGHWQTCIRTENFVMAGLIGQALISNGYKIKLLHSLNGFVYIKILEENGNEVGEWFR